MEGRGEGRREGRGGRGGEEEGRGGGGEGDIMTVDFAGSNFSSTVRPLITHTPTWVVLFWVGGSH